MANINVGRKSGFIMRSGVRRRESLWLFITETSTALAGALSASLIGTYNAAALALRPFTVVRTRGMWHVETDQLAVDESQHSALGMAIVSEQATGIGITAVPTPFTDDGSDLFFVYEEMALSLEVQSNIGTDFHRGTMLKYDSKAMRKVEDGQDIAVTLENSTLSNGTGILHHGRQLIKLH